jgi:hypothetical protein
MARATSPATGRRYGVARVCQIWEVPRSSFYATRRLAAVPDNASVAPARRGPKPILLIAGVVIGLVTAVFSIALAVVVIAGLIWAWRHI